MLKKISVDIWIEPATNIAGNSQFIDNIKDLIHNINNYGLNLNEDEYDLSVVNQEAHLEE
ncbi:MAG: hypothetical protein MJ211_09670 [Bacteroidales bacterium]|nr:hypothetical protein [Bacteroidales bacterium]